MSRIILKVYDNEEQHYVVGWDRPMATYYWQEFNKEPDPNPVTGRVDWEKHQGWEEMLGFAGYIPHELPTMDDFMASLPDKIKPYVTDDVKELLVKHRRNPDAGRIIVDMTEREASAPSQDG
ncbi:MAG TPA: hypothetical protein VM715_09485 [Candidatus Acidoferrum sp.]|nr:hypothetical protein [Candidatus Acidoferrum sp.]